MGVMEFNRYYYQVNKRRGRLNRQRYKSGDDEEVMRDMGAARKIERLKKKKKKKKKKQV
jgi:hypothetical protein